MVQGLHQDGTWMALGWHWDGVGMHWCGIKMVLGWHWDSVGMDWGGTPGLCKGGTRMALRQLRFKPPQTHGVEIVFSMEN